MLRRQACALDLGRLLKAGGLERHASGQSAAQAATASAAWGP